MTSQHNTLTYRKGSIADKEQLQHVGLVSFGQYFDQLSPENVAKMRTSLNDENKLVELINMSEIFVCADEDKIVGTAYFVPSGNPWDIFKAEWSYIRMVGVDPAYQGKGIAGKLTDQCIEHAKNTNETTIALHTSEMMHAARHIYETRGFTVLQEIPPRFDKKYWLYTLTLDTMNDDYTYPDQLTSERLVTRFLTAGDAPAWSEFFKDKEAIELFPESFLQAGAEQTAAFWIERQKSRYENNNYGLQALISKETGELIGQCGLLRQDVEEKDELEVGYHIIKKYWKQGYATEAAKLFIDHAFDNDLADSIISIIDVRNIRSQRVAEKNGMVRDRHITWNGLIVYIYRIHKPQ